MKKSFLHGITLVLLFSVCSCSKKAIELSDGEIIHCNTISKVGDSVQVLRRNWGAWEVEENPFKIQDTLYTVYAQDSLAGKINHVTIEKKRGKVIIIPYSLF